MDFSVPQGEWLGGVIETGGGGGQGKERGSWLTREQERGRKEAACRGRQGGRPPFYCSVMLCCPVMPRMSKQGSTLRAGRDLGFDGVAACWAVTGSYGLQSHPRLPQGADRAVRNCRGLGGLEKVRAGMD